MHTDTRGGVGRLGVTGQSWTLGEVNERVQRRTGEWKLLKEPYIYSREEKIQGLARRGWRPVFLCGGGCCVDGTESRHGLGSRQISARWEEAFSAGSHQDAERRLLAVVSGESGG